MNLHERISLWLISVLVMILGIAFLGLFQTQTAETNPRIYLGDVTVQQGNYGSMSLSIVDVTDYALLDIRIFYDSEYIHVYASNFGYAHQDMPIHEKLENRTPGVIHYTLISTENTSKEGQLLTVYFHVSLDAPIKDYTFTLAVDGVFNQDYQSIEVSKINGKVKVIATTSVSPAIYYQPMVSNGMLNYGDQFTYSIYSYDLKKLSASDYEVYYDRNVFELKSIAIGSELKKTGVIYSENHLSPGFFQLSFASSNGLNSAYPLFEITFESISNEDTSSVITFIPKNGYNEDLLLMQSVQSSTAIQINAVHEEIYPTLTIDSYEGANNQSFSVDVTLGADSMLAAGDFIIHYPEQLILEAIEVIFSGSFFIYNHQEAERKLSFSIIDLDGMTEETKIFKLTFAPIANTLSYVGTITLSGSSVVDTNFDPITLDYQNGTINLGYFYQVSFLDYDNRVIQSSYVKQGEMPTSPSVDLRPYTSFKSWDQTLAPVFGEQVYRAIYQLNLDEIIITNQEVTYDGLEKTYTMEGLPFGASVSYLHPQMIHASTYTIQAMMSLDGTYQGTIDFEFVIKKKIVTVTIEDHTMNEIEDIADWSYTIDGLVSGDEIKIDILSITGYTVGTHILSATTSHQDYTLDVVEGTLVVTPYDWMYGDVNYDQKVSITDVANIQLYLAGLIPFTNLQIKIADVNLSQTVSIADVSTIQLYLAGLYHDWPIRID